VTLPPRTPNGIAAPPVPPRPQPKQHSRPRERTALNRRPKKIFTRRPVPADPPPSTKNDAGAVPPVTAAIRRYLRSECPRQIGHRKLTFTGHTTPYLPDPGDASSFDQLCAGTEVLVQQLVESTEAGRFGEPVDDQSDRGRVLGRQFPLIDLADLQPQRRNCSCSAVRLPDQDKPLTRAKTPG